MKWGTASRKTRKREIQSEKYYEVKKICLVKKKKNYNKKKRKITAINNQIKTIIDINENISNNWV